jgi:hypothetical protein
MQKYNIQKKHLKETKILQKKIDMSIFVEIYTFDLFEILLLKNIFN